MTNRKEQAARLERAEEKAKALTTQLDAASAKAEKADKALADKIKEKDAVQTELDDLLMVFGDLEEKVNRYREKLKALGEAVSDAEDDEDEEEDEDA
jgi:chromosome segregation ATPase